MQATKIQINSLEALERLLGNDTELEAEIRSSIAAAFAEKHLKNMVRQAAEAGLTDSVKLLLEQEMYEQVPDPQYPGYYGRTLRVFKPKVVAELREQLVKIVADQVSEQTHNVAKDLYAKLEQGLEKLSNQLLKNLEPRIAEQIITERVKAKLASL